MDIAGNALLLLFALFLVFLNGFFVASEFAIVKLRMILHLSRAASEERTSDVNRMLTPLLDLPALHASDVMRPWRQVVAIPADASHSQVRRIPQRTRHSRYPCVEPGSGDEHGRGRASEIDREPRRLQDGSVLVRGDTPLFLLERELGLTIPESDTPGTVTGLLLERLGHLPRAGETLVFEGHTAVVLQVRGTAVESVQIARRS
jgi:CBS domain containing-hemolysin-like protein